MYSIPQSRLLLWSETPGANWMGAKVLDPWMPEESGIQSIQVLGSLYYGTV